MQCIIWVSPCPAGKPLIQVMMGGGSTMIAWGITSIKPLRQYKYA